MRKKNKKQTCRKIVLRLPDLDHARSSVLSSFSSPSSRRDYRFAMEQFITRYRSEPRLALNRAVILRFRLISNHSVLRRSTPKLDEGERPGPICCSFESSVRELLRMIHVRYGTETCTVLLAGPVLPSAAT